MVSQRAMRACLIVLPLTGSCSAARATQSDLLSVLNEALANDPVFGSARFAQQASSESEPQARAALLPNVSLSASINETRSHLVSDNNQIEPSFAQTFTTWGPTLQVALPLYRAQLWDALSQSKLTVRQSELQFAQAREDLMVRVAQAYFDVLASSDALAAIQTKSRRTPEHRARPNRESRGGTRT